MYKYCFTLIIALSSFILNGQNQNGLERIIVEKYYISDVNDATFNADFGVLPVGSTTYRVYVDMLPGYKFQSCYGSPESTSPAHLLKIATTTRFFNNEDRGGVSPIYNKNAARNNTVMLDSWVTGGGACVGNIGVPKYLDNGVDNVVNSDGILKNNNAEAGIPLNQQDGMVAGIPLQMVISGITDGPNGLNALLDNTNDTPLGSILSTDNGLWGVAGGAKGKDTLENIVLIGQFTTDGAFSFELNIQLGAPITNPNEPTVVEQYVARNPVNLERSIPSLIYPDSTVSVTHFYSKSHHFVVNPNPALESINVKFSDVRSSRNYFMIFDMKGTLVESGKFNVAGNTVDQLIDITALESGMYILQAAFDGMTKTGKFIKL